MVNWCSLSYSTIFNHVNHTWHWLPKQSFWTSRFHTNSQRNQHCNAHHTSGRGSWWCTIGLIWLGWRKKWTLRIGLFGRIRCSFDSRYWTICLTGQFRKAQGWRQSHTIPNCTSPRSPWRRYLCFSRNDWCPMCNHNVNSCNSGTKVYTCTMNSKF